MNRKIAVIGVILIAVSISLGINSAYAQEPVSLEDISFENEGIIIIIGVTGGLVSAWQGFSKTNTPFNPRKFIDRVIVSIIASVGIAIGAFASTSETGLFMYVMIFFASIGASQLTIKAIQPKKA